MPKIRQYDLTSQTIHAIERFIAEAPTGSSTIVADLTTALGLLVTFRHSNEAALRAAFTKVNETND